MRSACELIAEYIPDYTFGSDEKGNWWITNYVGDTVIHKDFTEPSKRLFGLRVIESHLLSDKEFLLANLTDTDILLSGIAILLGTKSLYETRN